MKIKWIIILIFVLVVFSFFFTSLFKPINLERMSPKEIMSLYLKSRNKGDMETLRKIIYFPPGMSEEEKTAKVRLATTGFDEKTAMSMAMAGIKAECEKIINDDTAQVGLVVITGVGGIGKRTPFIEIVMKKDEGIWKYDYDKYSFTEKQLIEAIRKNPKDASAYYYLGRLYQPQNPARANRYYKKYYELEPEGFWVNESLLRNLKSYDDIQKEEEDASAKLYHIPEKSPNRATLYTTLGQLFMEHGDYQKAQMYLEESESVLKYDHDQLEIEALEKAKKELELRKSGQYHDILDEIERRQK
jgi:tetratricopeptide (TPR) repeat protein